MPETETRMGRKRHGRRTDMHFGTDTGTDTGAGSAAVAGPGTFGREPGLSAGCRTHFVFPHQKGLRRLVEPVAYCQRFALQVCLCYALWQAPVIGSHHACWQTVLTRLNSYSAFFLSSGFALSGCVRKHAARYAVRTGKCRQPD